jgi:hypothetical protein
MDRLEANHGRFQEAIHRLETSNEQILETVNRLDDRLLAIKAESGCIRRIAAIVESHSFLSLVPH